MEKAYVSVRRGSRQKSVKTLVLTVVGGVFFVLAGLYMQGEYTRLREELIENLQKGKEVADANNRLKMELSVITRARYIELKANERLGLKKPKEEEVLVLK